MQQSYVARPDAQVRQQVRVNLVPLARLACSSSRIQRRQVHLSPQSHFTTMGELRITIAGAPFMHRLYHFVLTFSRWEHVEVIEGGESYRKPRYRVGKPECGPQSTRTAIHSRAARPRLGHGYHLCTAEGWLYLAVVLDLYSRAVIGWSMKPTLARGLVLDALLMAVWRRRPKPSVIVHSDQGSQYGSDGWVRFCQDHALLPSMSRRGNCFDNAVAEAFFRNLKKERVRRRIYATRAKPVAISSTTSKSFITGPVGMAILGWSARITLKEPHCEAVNCLRIWGRNTFPSSRRQTHARLR